MDGLTPGCLVLYVLSDRDCRAIAAQQPDALRVAADGTQGGLGSIVVEGRPCPARVVTVVDPDTGCADLRVTLTDAASFEAASRYYTAQGETGTWHFPTRGGEAA